MKKLSFLQLFCCFVVLAGLLSTGHSFAQVCGAPGKDGVTFSRNTYYSGVGTANSGATLVNLGTALVDTDAATTAFSVGDLALIIQMQDALVNNTNTDAYGDGVFGGTASGYSDLRNAGLYEFKRVTAVAGSSISFDSGLINTYTTSNADTTTGNRRFQVVRVPQFASVSMPSGTLIVPTWNGSTGGLIAVDASGNLNLNGVTINANEKGFRGGGSQPEAITSGSNIVDYAVAAGTGVPPNTLGAAKGEGIAGTPRYVHGTTVADGHTGLDLGVSGYQSSLDYARGAPANAGGGGNQHNAGGGGGGNAGTGGNGGRSFGFYSATNTGATCVTLTASFFSCTGDGSRAVGGYGGTGTAPVATRLYLGGGGGSGETNNATDNPTIAQGSGGNGGGLVFIRARSISGSGTINANGQDGEPGGRDAGGGGGAGGTVVVVTDSTSVPGLVVNTNGGVGGNTGLPLTGGETQGTGGGGGGGGFIRSSGLVTTGAISVNGGAAGLNQPATGIFNALNATSGAGGVVNVNFSGNQYPNPNSCYPQLTVTKSTTTPSRTVPPDTTGQYVINVSNATGVGSAVGVAVIDVLPAPFTLASTSATVALGSGSLGPSPTAPSSGTTTVTIATAGGATPAASFLIPPGGSVTLTFPINLNGAAVGTYQNPARVLYGDPSRSTDTATVTPGGSYSAGGTVGGNNYASASTTNEDITIISTAKLSISKTNTVTSVVAGSTSSYAITVTNSGPGNAPGAIIKDPVAAGLSCTAVTCSIVSGTASCPTTLTIALLQGSGFVMPTFNNGAVVQFLVTCAATATGQ